MCLGLTVYHFVENVPNNMCIGVTLYILGELCIVLELIIGMQYMMTESVYKHKFIDRNKSITITSQ